jgi:hypothetical protein
MRNWPHVKIYIVSDDFPRADFLIEAEDSETETIELGRFVKDPITGEIWAVDAFPVIPRVGDELCVGEVLLKAINVTLWGASGDAEEDENSRILAHIDCGVSPPQNVATADDPRRIDVEALRVQELNRLLEEGDRDEIWQICVKLHRFWRWRMDWRRDVRPVCGAQRISGVVRSGWDDRCWLARLFLAVQAAEK